MRVLVLGGTRHVGRSLVEEAVAAGHRVTTLNRGRTRAADPGVETLRADRLEPGQLAVAVAGRTWDAAFDTWSGAPAVVADAAAALAGRVRHYGYVSSRSVYRWPPAPGADERAPVVTGDPDRSDDTDYAAAKRGGELAVLRVFGAAALCARAGLILGPYEQVGRMPFWLNRLARGGVVPVPGPPGRGLQYVDGRDLAAWMLRAADEDRTGFVDAVSPPAFTTTGALLQVANDVTGGRSRLRWIDPDVIAAAGVAPWTELPIWVPPSGEMAGLHDSDSTAAAAAGLTCRPMSETVADTWAWLRREGTPPAPARRGAAGMSADHERALLDGQAAADTG